MSLTVARELAVLSIVIAHPVHGYEIASAFEKGPMQLLGLKRPAVYSILARFVKRGWVEERQEPGGSYPDRQICYPTDLGRAAIGELVIRAGGLPQTPLLSLIMLRDAGVDVSESLRAQLQSRRTTLKSLAEPDSEHAHSFSALLASRVVEAEIEVIANALADTSE
ncbi:PadR family transcriptional regulator [Cucumibacter marinus]|uniref:PadR family transcriptional regulator n=1 Tax=Cucumibacter marinus TaxID=1121252 RepID=UPI00040F0FC9|nr:PadR family transcriptional regulator [Cucumibacter marinus]